MKLTPIQLISVLAVILLTFACLFRYTLTPANTSGEGTYAHVYKLDRWTGNVDVIQGAIYTEVTRRKDQ